MRIDKGKTKQNFIYNIIYEVIRVIIPLLTTPYISRVLGSVGIGQFALAQTYAGYFVLFGVLGLNSYATRALAYTRDDEIKFISIFWHVFSAKALTMVISIIVYVIVFFELIPSNLSNKIFLIYLISEIFNIGFYFIAVERFRTIAIRNTFIKFLSMILIFLLVKKSNQIWIYTLIIVLSDVIGQIVNWLSVDKIIYKRICISLDNFFEMMKVSLSLFLPTLAIQIYTMLDKVMLGLLIGESETGFYENANKMIRLASTIASAVIAVFIPKMSNDFANHRIDSFNNNIKRVFKFVNFLCLPMCFGLMAIIKDFAPWFYGDDFSGIEILFYIGSVMIVFLGWSGLFGSMVLVPCGKQKYYTISVSIGAIVNIIMNCLLIPKIGAAGAILASALSELLGMIIMFTFTKKLFCTDGLFKSAIKYFFSSLVMFIFVFLESCLLQAGIVATCLEVILGVVLYIGILFVMNDDIIKEIFAFNIQNHRK